MINPTALRLSKHFLLSDFMGCHSVYTRGLPNRMVEDTREMSRRIANGTCLCEYALEPILDQYGPVSISYGYIDPELSRQIVTYQDPDKPSHHRWDLGAAADVCVHGWVNSDPDDDTSATAPITLAHNLIDNYPLSRLITYSESPYLCVAVAAREIENGTARSAFYENRYQGVPKVKPKYTQMPNVQSRQRAAQALAQDGLQHGWRGAGYPTYHGGGRRQYHHVRISKYTMLSDWLFDPRTIANGARNMPDMRDPDLWELFYLVGDTYDEIIEMMQVPRMSIVGGYVSPTNPYFNPANDWRSGIATFSLIPPEGMTPEDVRLSLLFKNNGKIIGFGSDPHRLDITVQL